MSGSGTSPGSVGAVEVRHRRQHGATVAGDGDGDHVGGGGGGGSGHLLCPPQTQPQQLQAAAADWEESMVGCVAALLPCLPARELQAIDRSAHPSDQSMSDESVSSFFFFFW